MKHQRRRGSQRLPDWSKGEYGNNDPRIKKIFDNERKTRKACRQIYRLVSTRYRRISGLAWTGTRAVKLAAKLKEDNEASPTT